MAKRKLLNVKSNLEHCQLIFEGLKKYGYCPALVEEVNKASLLTRAILKAAEEKRKLGNRKDINVGL